MACSRGFLEAVKILLTFGADPHLQDAEGRNALSVAMESEHPHCVYFIQSKLKKLPSEFPRRRALIIAQTNYDHLAAQTSKAVPNAAGDMQLLTRRLKGLNFEVFLGVDLTTHELNEYVDTFVEQLRVEDFAAFYFIGLGGRQGQKSLLFGRDKKFSVVPNEDVLSVDDVLDAFLTRPLQRVRRRRREALPVDLKRRKEIESVRGPSLMIVDISRKVPKMALRGRPRSRSLPFETKPEDVLGRRLLGAQFPLDDYMTSPTTPKMQDLAESDHAMSPYCCAPIPLDRVFAPGAHLRDLSKEPGSSSAFLLYAHTPSETLEGHIFETFSRLKPPSVKQGFIPPRALQIISDHHTCDPKTNFVIGIPNRLADLSNRCSASRTFVQEIRDAPWPGVFGWDNHCKEGITLTDRKQTSLFAESLQEALAYHFRLSDALRKTCAFVLERTRRVQKPCVSMASDANVILL
eukprot:GEMP01046366.1.p1 GENE.GEMP01046366.1~~GEMP01046366.1.p1  ORF type:complete len:542 (+),score=102.95 GEMP01046366.1:241-1626(+)